MNQALTAHQKLKIICDKIGFSYRIKKFGYWESLNVFKFTIDEREIIFTQEFMDLFEEYLLNIPTNNEYVREEFYFGIMANLDSPTEYLFNLLK